MAKMKHDPRKIPPEGLWMVHCAVQRADGSLDCTLVGNEPAVVVDFQGLVDYAKAH